MYYLLWYALTTCLNNDLTRLIIKKYTELLYYNLVLSLNRYNDSPTKELSHYQRYPHALHGVNYIKICRGCKIKKTCSLKCSYILICDSHIDKCLLYVCSTCASSFKFAYEWSIDETTIYNIMKEFITPNDDESLKRLDKAFSQN
jgi:hypothetical protein